VYVCERKRGGEREREDRTCDNIIAVITDKERKTDRKMYRNIKIKE